MPRSERDEPQRPRTGTILVHFPTHDNRPSKASGAQRPEGRIRPANRTSLPLGTERNIAIGSWDRQERERAARASNEQVTGPLVFFAY